MLLNQKEERLYGSVTVLAGMICRVLGCFERCSFLEESSDTGRAERVRRIFPN